MAEICRDHSGMGKGPDFCQELRNEKALASSVCSCQMTSTTKQYRDEVAQLTLRLTCLVDSLTTGTAFEDERTCDGQA